MINYFNFKKIDNKFLVTNDFGEYIFLSPEEFRLLYSNAVDENNKKFQELVRKGFIIKTSKNLFVEERQYQVRRAKNYLLQSTQLHIFVVTTACNMKCIYCQAQNGKNIPKGFMTKEIAKNAVDIALQSPSKYLQFEFQGGEPLLNFEVIKYIIEYSRKKSGNKVINFSIVTNLSMMTEDILTYIEENNINISTSLDGNRYVHDCNRVFRTNQGSYEKVTEMIKKIKNRKLFVGAIQTTTRKSLLYYKEIVDTYIELQFNNIFLRPLTPLGCANKKWDEIGYSAEEFLDFYEKAFSYILEINKNGYILKEGTAVIFLRKILLGTAINYMELRSPCGGAIGQLAYYYDGRVYTCDEGRMLAEMGNSAFYIGNVLQDNYSIFMDTRVCKAVCSSSILESLPSCSDCVYQPYCGVCPVVNFALYDDTYEREPNGYRCKIYKGILNIIFKYLQSGNTDVEKIFRSWL